MTEHKLKSAPQVIELPELHPHGGTQPSILSGTMDVISNVKVRLAVRVGDAEVSVGELMAMKEEHILKLTAALDTPVDVLLETAKARAQAMHQHTALMEKAFRAGERGLADLLRSRALTHEADIAAAQQTVAIGLAHAQFNQAFGIVP